MGLSTWAGRLKEGIRGRISDEIGHRLMVRDTYNEAKREEEVRYARERARRDVRGTGRVGGSSAKGGRSAKAERLMGLMSGGSSENVDTIVGGSSRSIDAIAGGGWGGGSSSGRRSSGGKKYAVIDGKAYPVVGSGSKKKKKKRHSSSEIDRINKVLGGG